MKRQHSFQPFTDWYQKSIQPFSLHVARKLALHGYYSASYNIISITGTYYCDLHGATETSEVTLAPSMMETANSEDSSAQVVPGKYAQ